MPINPSPAVQRAGQVLWYLAEHPSQTHTVAQLSRALAIPRATCDSILQALTQQGFVNRAGRDLGYQLGASCLALAASAQTANTALNVANLQADALARELQACVVVSTVIAGETRAIAVFDRSAATLFPLRVGHTVPLAPPFGVVFAAWDPAASERWLAAGGPETSEDDIQRWRQSLRFARQNGYSFTVYASPGEDFGEAMDKLAMAPDSEPTRQTRDKVMRELRHSDYLATEVDPDAEVQLMQIAAPVFDAEGNVAVSIMILGSLRPIRGTEVEELGRRLTDAANRATTMARELERRAPSAAM